MTSATSSPTRARCATALALPEPRDWRDGVSALLRHFGDAEQAAPPRTAATALSA